MREATRRECRGRRHHGLDQETAGNERREKPTLKRSWSARSSIPRGYALGRFSHSHSAIFTDLDFSTHKAANVTFAAMDGASQVGTASYSDLGNDLVHWLVVATNNAQFTSFIITTTDGFSELKQFSISGVCSTTECPPHEIGLATPLPTALPLFAGGLGIIGLAPKCRKRKTATAA